MKLIKKYPLEAVNLFRNDLIELFGLILDQLKTRLLPEIEADFAESMTKERQIDALTDDLENRSSDILQSEKLHTDEIRLLTGSASLLFNFQILHKGIVSLKKELSASPVPDKTAIKTALEELILLFDQLFVFFTYREMERYEEIQNGLTVFKEMLHRIHNAQINRMLNDENNEKSGMATTLVITQFHFFADYFIRMAEVIYFIHTAESPDEPVLS